MASTATSTTGRDTPDSDSGTVCYDLESNEVKFFGLITADADDLLAQIRSLRCAEVAESLECGLRGDLTSGFRDSGDEILKRVNEAVEQWDLERDEAERADEQFCSSLRHRGAARLERDRERVEFVVRTTLSSLARRTAGRQDSDCPTVSEKGPARRRAAASGSFRADGMMTMPSSPAYRWKRQTQFPSPGQSFMITDRACEHALSLQNGSLKLISLAATNPFGTAGCWVWECVESNGWLGFKNWASGTYLGHNGSAQVLWAERKHHKGHEQFCVRQVDGGYILLMESWGKLGKVGAAIDKGGPQWKVVLEGTPVVWNFVKV